MEMLKSSLNWFIYRLAVQSKERTTGRLTAYVRSLNLYLSWDLPTKLISGLCSVFGIKDIRLK